MNAPGDLLDVTLKLVEALERLGAEYAIGGAIAQNYWGTVRATQDIDLLVSLPRIRFEELAAVLTDAGLTLADGNPVTVESIVAQELDRHLFVMYHGSVKVEVFLPFLPLQRSILRRVVMLPLGPRQVPITTAEDLILLKMAFHREKDLRDVRGILWSQKGKLDLGYIRDWAKRMLEGEHERELERWIVEYAGP